VPQMPYPDPASYLPTWIELAISAGSLALFALFIALLVKVVPVISIWEIREHEEMATASASVPAAELTLPGSAPVTEVMGS